MRAGSRWPVPCVRLPSLPPWRQRASVQECNQLTRQRSSLSAVTLPGQQFQPWRACRHSCRPRPHTPPPATPPHAHAHALHAGRAAPASPCGGLHLVEEVLAHALLLKAAHLRQLRKQLAAHPGAEQETGQGRQLSKEAQQGSSARKLLSWQCCAGDRLACEQGALHQAW